MRVYALALVLLAGSAGAQTMYRCGNTFSQQPCGPAAQEIKAAGVPQPVVDTFPEDPAKSTAMRLACREWLTRMPGWKDPESLRIGEIRRGRLADADVAGSKQRVRVYATVVNAKNGFGGYGGERIALCLSNVAETKILDHEIKP